MHSVEVLQDKLQVAQDEVVLQRERIDSLLARERSAGELLDGLVRFLPLPVVITDETGLVQEANPAAGALFGVPAASLDGAPLPDHVALEDRQRVRSLIAPALSGTEASARVLVLRDGAATGEVEFSVTSLRSPVRLHWALRELTTGAAAPVWSAATVVETVQALARMSFSEPPAAGVLGTLLDLAVEVVDGADWASLNVGDPRTPEETASGSRYAQLADGVQWRNGAGPTQDAWDGGEIVGSGDVHHDLRWPTRGWVGNPVRSVLALPIRLDGVLVGVLTVYGSERDGLGASTHGVAQVVAAVAGAVLAGERRMTHLRSTADQMRAAMASRSGIEQAKGLLAGATGCSPGAAFEALSSLSQRQNVKLRDLATTLLSDPGRGVLLTELRAEVADAGFTR